MNDWHAARVRRDAKMRAARVEVRRQGPTALVHAVDPTIVTSGADAGAVATRGIRIAQTLLEVLVEVPRIGVIATRIEKLYIRIVAQMLHHQLCGVGVDPTVNGVAAKATHARNRAAKAVLERPVQVDRGAISSSHR